MNVDDPFLMGVPYTMWMGLLVSLLFVVLAYLAAMTNKDEDHAD